MTGDDRTDEDSVAYGSDIEWTKRWSRLIAVPALWTEISTGHGSSVHHAPLIIDHLDSVNRKQRGTG
jgi:hypothetical protein